MITSMCPVFELDIGAMFLEYFIKLACTSDCLIGNRKYCDNGIDIIIDEHSFTRRLDLQKQ